ncbi:unnamed protein product [Closterium sp. NIES-54]
MRAGAVEELAIGAVGVAATADVVSAAVDVVSAAVDVVSFCRIVANALVLSASGMGPALSSVSHVDPVEPVEVAVDSGAARGVGAAGTGASGAGAAGGAAATGGAGGAAGAGAARSAAGAGATGAVSPRGARIGGTGAAGAGGAAGVGAAGTGASGAGAAGGAAATGGAGGAAGAGAAGAAGPGGSRHGGTRAAGSVPRDHGAECTGAVSAVFGGTARPRPYFVLLLQQVLGPTPPLLSPPPVQSQSQFQPASPLPGPSPYSGPTRGLTERRELESRAASPESRSASPVRIVHTSRRVSRPRPPPVPGTHSMTLRPSTAPQHVPLPSPPASSLPTGPDPESDSLRAASPTVSRFLAIAVTDPLFESTAASALVTKIVDFAAACRLDFATSLIAESVSASLCPPSVGGECALGTNIVEDRQEEFECFAASVPHLVSMLLAPEGDPDAPDIPTPRSYAEAIEGPYSSQWQAAMDAEMASWKSTGTYVDEVPPPGANIVSAMWIFRVKRPPGSPPVFKARYVARGFSQRHGVDFFQTFSPTPKMTTLRVLLHVAAQRDYELHLLAFNTAFLQGSLHEEIWLRRPPGFTGSFPAGTQWSFRRPVYALRQAPREWHDTLRTTLAPLGFAPSTADPSLFLRTDTTLPPFYVLVHRKVHWDAAKRVLRYLCSTSGIGLVLGGWARVVLTGHADASWVDDLATQRSSLGYTFSLGSGSVSWRSTRSSSVLSSSCEAEIYAGAMAAQELCWLTYLLTDLGEAPRSPFLYVDNKAMLALCQEHRLEHRMKHIVLRYLLARELQQRGQLRLAYVASQANTADVFTKALQPCDHQHFCCLALVHDTSADKLSACAVPCVFLGFPSPQQPSALPRQVTVDSVGVGARGAATGGTRSGGARSKGAGAGGAGTGGASSGGAGAGGAGTGGASSGGAGVGGPRTGGARIGGAGARDPDPVGTPSGDTGFGQQQWQPQQQPPQPQQQQQQQQPPPPPPPQPQQVPLERQMFPPVSGLRALGLHSSPPVRPPSPPGFGPTFSPPDARLTVWSSPPPQSPPLVVRHYRSCPYPPSACLSSPVTDLHTVLLCTSLRCSPPLVLVLPSPPPPSLPVSPTPISDYYRVVRPVVSRVLATGVTKTRFCPSFVSALTRLYR